MRISSMTEEFDTGTATGRLMLTLLSGFAAHERDVIRERSIAGTFRVAEAGVWLGGIVPYGYRKVGEKRDARLVVCEDPVPGAAMPEAEVIREIFRMSAAERKSCCFIAKHLNQLNVPCAYARDDRFVLRAKLAAENSRAVAARSNSQADQEAKRTWEFTSTGKRSSSGRQVVARSVPAIVTEEIWNKAQQSIAANFRFSRRSARNQYLLRGLIKCGLCGLTYIGVAGNRPNGRREFYYRCNGVHSRGLYGNLGQICPSKVVRGDRLEELVWSDVEGFLRNPGPVLEQFRAKLETDSTEKESLKSHERRLEELRAAKVTERSRVLGLYRRGRLGDVDLDQQMSEIALEEAGIQAQLEEIEDVGCGAPGPHQLLIWNRPESSAHQAETAAGQAGFVGMQASARRGPGERHPR